MPFHKIGNFLYVLFSERLEIEKLAVKWFNLRKERK